MRFTLTYDGQLSPNARAPHKHAIREHLHSQIKELWTHRPLSDHREWLDDPSSESEVWKLTEVDGHYFAPLVSDAAGLLAELDILMLRPERPGRIIQGADIDNRLKTLFDALQAPTLKQDIPPGADPHPESEPLHVLVSDDSLINRVNVETDRLLNPPHHNDVRLIIRVTTRIERAMWGNMSLWAG